MHIDGYNLLPYLTGEEAKTPRKGFIYFSDDGDLVALRFDNWKLVFMEQRRRGRWRCGRSRFRLRVPKLFNLRTDPFERADMTSNTYWDWYISKAYMIMAAQAIVAEFLATFKDFPPRQKAASFTIDQALEKMADAASGAPIDASLALLARHADARGDRRASPRRLHSAVPPEERVAVFDNDGTLWCEKPMPVELGFILERLAAMAEADESLRTKQPWKAAYERDYAWLGGVIDKHYAGDDSDVKVLMGGILQAFAGQTVEEYVCGRGRFLDRRSIRPSGGSCASARTCR